MIPHKGAVLDLTVSQIALFGEREVYSEDEQAIIERYKLLITSSKSHRYPSLYNKHGFSMCCVKKKFDISEGVGAYRLFYLYNPHRHHVILIAYEKIPSNEHHLIEHHKKTSPVIHRIERILDDGFAEHDFLELYEQRDDSDEEMGLLEEEILSFANIKIQISCLKKKVTRSHLFHFFRLVSQFVEHIDYCDDPELLNQIHRHILNYLKIIEARDKFHYYMTKEKKHLVLHVNIGDRYYREVLIASKKPTHFLATIAPWLKSVCLPKSYLLFLLKSDSIDIEAAIAYISELMLENNIVWDKLLVNSLLDNYAQWFDEGLLEHDFLLVILKQINIKSIHSFIEKRHINNIITWLLGYYLQQSLGGDDRETFIEFMGPLLSYINNKHLEAMLHPSNTFFNAKDVLQIHQLTEGYLNFDKIPLMLFWCRENHCSNDPDDIKALLGLIISLYEQMADAFKPRYYNLLIQCEPLLELYDFDCPQSPYPPINIVQIDVVGELPSEDDDLVVNDDASEIVEPEEPIDLLDIQAPNEACSSQDVYNKLVLFFKQKLALGELHDVLDESEVAYFVTTFIENKVFRLDDEIKTFFIKNVLMDDRRYDDIARHLIAKKKKDFLCNQSQQERYLSSLLLPYNFFEILPLIEGGNDILLPLGKLLLHRDPQLLHDYSLYSMPIAIYGQQMSSVFELIFELGFRVSDVEKKLKNPLLSFLFFAADTSNPKNITHIAKFLMDNNARLDWHINGISILHLALWLMPTSFCELLILRGADPHEIIVDELNVRFNLNDMLSVVAVEKSEKERLLNNRGIVRSHAHTVIPCLDYSNHYQEGFFAKSVAYIQFKSRTLDKPELRAATKFHIKTEAEETIDSCMDTLFRHINKKPARKKKNTKKAFQFLKNNVDLLNQLLYVNFEPSRMSAFSFLHFLILTGYDEYTLYFLSNYLINLNIISSIYLESVETQGIVEYENQSALQLAMRRNRSPEIIRALLEHGANLDVPHQFGKSPLRMAVEIGEIKLIQLLLEYAQPGTVNIPDKSHCTPLHYAIKSALTPAEKVNVVKFLVIECGADYPGNDDLTGKYKNDSVWLLPLLAQCRREQVVVDLEPDHGGRPGASR